MPWQCHFYALLCTQSRRIFDIMFEHKYIFIYRYIHLHTHKMIHYYEWKLHLWYGIKCLCECFMRTKPRKKGYEPTFQRVKTINIKSQHDQPHHLCEKFQIKICHWHKSVSWFRKNVFPSVLTWLKQSLIIQLQHIRTFSLGDSERKTQIRCNNMYSLLLSLHFQICFVRFLQVN